MKLRTITIDLAKTVFQACGVNEHMKPQFNTRLKREQLLDFMRPGAFNNTSLSFQWTNIIAVWTSIQ
jgi:hypothetical protein